MDIKRIAKGYDGPLTYAHRFYILEEMDQSFERHNLSKVVEGPIGIGM